MSAKDRKAERFCWAVLAGVSGHEPGFDSTACETFSSILRCSLVVDWLFRALTRTGACLGGTSGYFETGLEERALLLIRL